MAQLDDAPVLNPRRSAHRVWLARGVAVVADLIQVAALPITAEGAFSPVDDGLDLLTGAILSLLVGPHLAFVPSFLVKLLPIADLAPTWTIAVLIATGGRRTDVEPLAPVPMLPVGDPGARHIGRSARVRAVAWFTVLFTIGFVVGGLFLMPQLPPIVGTSLTPGTTAFWAHNWAGALLGGGLGVWATRTVLRRAGRG